MKFIYVIIVVIFTAIPFALYAQANRDIPELMRERLNEEKAIQPDSVITVTFNHTQTITDLMRIKTWLEVHSIKLTYRKLMFDEDGKLEAITFHVMDAKAGGSDTAEHLTNESTVGFYYDYRQDARFVFGAGELERIRPLK